MAVGYAVQHHVERRRAACAGEQALSGFIELVREADIGKSLAKGGLRLPVQGDRPLSDEACAGQEKHARINGAQPDAAPGHALQGGRQDAFAHYLRLKTRHHHKVRRPTQAPCLGREGRQALVRHQAHPVRSLGRLAAWRHHRPAIKRAPGQPIGDAQGLDSGKEGQGRVEIHQQKAEHLVLIIHRPLLLDGSIARKWGLVAKGNRKVVIRHPIAPRADQTLCNNARTPTS